MTLTGQLLQLLKKIELRYKNKTNLQKNLVYILGVQKNFTEWFSKQ